MPKTTKPKTTKPVGQRASVYVIGVTATGNGVGPTRVPRQEVVAVMAEVTRNGYLAIAYVAPHAGMEDGDFLYTPDTPNQILLPSERIKQAAAAAQNAVPIPDPSFRPV